MAKGSSLLLTFIAREGGEVFKGGPDPVFEESEMLYRQEIVEEMGINSQQMKGRGVINDSLLKVVTSSSS